MIKVAGATRKFAAGRVSEYYRLSYPNLFLGHQFNGSRHEVHCRTAGHFERFPPFRGANWWVFLCYFIIAEVFKNFNREWGKRGSLSTTKDILKSISYKPSQNHSPNHSLFISDSQIRSQRYKTGCNSITFSAGRWSSELLFLIWMMVFRSGASFLLVEEGCCWVCQRSRCSKGKISP